MSAPQEILTRKFYVLLIVGILLGVFGSTVDHEEWIKFPKLVSSNFSANLAPVVENISGVIMLALVIFHGFSYMAGMIICTYCIGKFLMHLQRPSNRSLKMLCALPILIFVCMGGIWLSPSCRVVKSFDNLEQNAKKVITGSELRAWATSLLAQHPTNATLKVSELGTNFPQQLRGLAPKFGPDVWIQFEDGTNSPGCVMIGWGSGFMGHCGFEIGPTNLASNRRGHAWQDGVYFWNDHGH